MSARTLGALLTASKVVALSSARLRVAYVDHCAKMSGAEIALLRLLPFLPTTSPLVVLGEDGPLVPRLRAAGVETTVLPLDPHAGDLGRDRVTPRGLPLYAAGASVAYARRLARELRRAEVRVVHTNSNKAHLYGGLAARLAGLPQVWHARDRVAPEFMPPPAVRLMRGAARVLPRTVIANSWATLDTLPGARRLDTVSPVLRDPFDGPARERRPRTGPFTFVMVGRLTPWKGQDVFLRAFAAASAGDVATRAVLVGDALFGESAFKEQLQSLVAELGLTDRVRFAGHVDDVDAELAQADALVHASVIPEPFGQVVVEGMRAGLPVVAADAGGPAEIIEDGRTGLLVPPRDPAALAAALRRLLDEPGLAEELGRAGQTAAEAYRPGPIAGQLEDVYAEILGARPAAGPR